MIGDHVAQRTGRIVVAAALLDSERFGHRDLNVVDKIAIPYWLENAVSKAKNQDILYSFLAQVMIDAVYLPFFEKSQELRIKLFGRLEIMTEWFFENKAPPDTILFLAKSIFDYLFGNV